MRNWLLACSACLLTAAALPAEERHFVVLLAAQDGIRSPNRTHTFAAFLKVDVGEPDDEGVIPTEAVEKFTISWLPDSGQVRLLARPERGRNFDLTESLKWAKERELKVTAHGPFEIPRELYERARKQKERLESGSVAYKAIDGRFRGGSVTNCIHAVSDLIPGPLLGTGTANGEEATALVAEHYRPHLRDAKTVHAWAMRHLDLRGEPVEDRNEPGTRTVNTPVFAE